MAAYAVCLYNVLDQSWPPKYKEPVTRLIAKHGGKYIARRSTCPWEMMEGAPPDITGVTLIEFPTMEAARDWHEDPEYQPFIKLRQGGSKVDMILVEGCDG
jgi:uncharacterized protein (DUF1330 family)